MAGKTELALSVGDLAARAGIEGRCPAIAVAAPHAESVPDPIDVLVEAEEALDVLTTFHTGADAIEEAISMLYTSYGAEGPIDAFNDSPSLVETCLKRMALLP